MISVPLTSVMPRVYFAETCKGNLKIHPHMETCYRYHNSLHNGGPSARQEQEEGSVPCSPLSFTNIHQLPRTLVLRKTEDKVLILLPLWSLCTTQSAQKGCKGREQVTEDYFCCRQTPTCCETVQWRARSFLHWIHG